MITAPESREGHAQVFWRVHWAGFLGLSFEFGECGAETEGETRVGYVTDRFEDWAVPLEIGAEHLRQGEDVASVGD